MIIISCCESNIIRNLQDAHEDVLELSSLMHSSAANVVVVPFVCEHESLSDM
jgi:hypothetical protein